jgi:hypothetical protein
MIESSRNPVEEVSLDKMKILIPKLPVGKSNWSGWWTDESGRIPD